MTGEECPSYVATIVVPARDPKLTVLVRGQPSQKVTYRREFVSCGRCSKCQTDGPSHGPYWYAYWKEGGRTRSRYLGKATPEGSGPHTQEDEPAEGQRSRRNQEGL